MARASVAPRIRARAIAPERRRLVRELDRYWPAMLERLAPGLERVVGDLVPTKADPALVDEVEIALRTLSWDREARILSRVVTPVVANIAGLGFESVSRELGLTVSFELSARPVQAIIGEVGTRITQVTSVSRGRIARMIADGIGKGLSVEQIVRGVPPGVTNIRGPVPAFPGISGLVDSWGSTGIAPRLGPGTGIGSRSYLIALTETGNAFNRSSLAAYASTGFVTIVEVFDGPDCGWSSHDDPSLAHGSKRRIEACQAQPLSHPRCQRAFGATLDDAPSASPYQGRDPGNVPGASPGLRPDDVQPYNGRQVPISGGFPGTPASGAPPGGLAAALEDGANRIRTIADHEVGLVFDQDGNLVLDKLGQGATARTAGSVDFTDAELASMRGKILMHNHPGAYQQGFDHATSFSSDDLLLAKRYAIAEMRVVGKGADFVARVPDDVGFGEWKAAIDAADQRVRATTYQAIAIDKAAARKAASVGGHFDVIGYGRAEKAIYDEASREHWHRVWELLARQFPGFTYSRTLRPGVG